MRALLILLLLPSMAFAEVSDKVPSISFVALEAVVGLIVSFALFQWRVVAGALGAVVCLALAWSTVDIVSDDYLRAALIEEQGLAYLWVSYANAVLLVAGPCVGLAYRLWRRRVAA